MLGPIIGNHALANQTSKHPGGITEGSRGSSAARRSEAKAGATPPEGASESTDPGRGRRKSETSQSKLDMPQTVCAWVRPRSSGRALSHRRPDRRASLRFPLWPWRSLPRRLGKEDIGEKSVLNLLDLQLPAVGVGNRPADCEAEAVATGLCVARVVWAVKRFVGSLRAPTGHGFALVENLERLTRVGLQELDRNSLSLCGVLGRVFEEVAHQDLGVVRDGRNGCLVRHVEIDR